MMYLLTEEEYQNLTKHNCQVIELETEKLQELCTKIADTMPVTWGWGAPDPKPWGCILSIKHNWYCDKCPVVDICPHFGKEFSK